MCANIASAPQLSAFGVAVAACPPLAMLLAVELRNRAIHHRAETTETTAAGGETRATVAETSGETTETDRETMIIRGETGNGTNPPLHLTLVPRAAARREPTAEERMWVYYQAQRARGRTPTGADLDRIADTNNYGRRILRRWRTDGRLPAPRPPSDIAVAS